MTCIYLENQYQLVFPYFVTHLIRRDSWSTLILFFSSNHYSGMTIAVSAGGILFEAIFAINVRTLPVICVDIADLF